MKKNGDYFEVVHAPFVEGFSEGLQRKFKKVKIGFVPKKRNSIESLCKLKQKVGLLRIARM